MSRRLILAIAVVALLAVPAFASVQNVKVSGDIGSTWLMRDNFDLGVLVIGDEGQNLLITQTRLRIDADLSDNVSTVIRLINERVWDSTEAAGANDIDLDLANVTLKGFLYSPLTVIAGRQNLRYGNGFIVGDNDTNNATGANSGLGSIAEDLTKVKAFDAVRAILDYDPLLIDLVIAKIDSNTLTGTSFDRNDDVDLYGVNANYKLGDKWGTTAEAYLFTKIDHSVDVGGAAIGTDKADKIYTPGLRASTNPIEGLNVQAEIAWQLGNKVTTTTQIGNNQRREALGIQTIATYQLPILKQWKPVSQFVYTYTSGDSNNDTTQVVSPGHGALTGRTPNVWTAWDPMFEDQGGHAIYNTLFNLTNSHIFSLSAQVSPREDITTKVTWTGLWLDRDLRGATLALVNPDGTTRTVATKSGEGALGNEIDTELSYAYTEDVKLGLSAGWFIPGDVFDARINQTTPANPGPTNDHIATQYLVTADVAF